ncbi:anti-sigma factor antagonist [Bacillus sp. MRMR6]|uniref:anti-sigma factor antagonist n=1 Tax=Bacillus sp. MRMR6 TaxID=1928617 RepID=UPI000952EDC6|nr:anti-sigma factor antagonist [Bacillus sp. MRMR6]OLS41169.1 anti-anti sigma factor [Bacillus sp. MRMR6]
MDLKIDKHHINGETFVQVTGEIDAFTAPMLREKLFPLAEADNQTVVISLKEVSYLDSTGLGVFVGLFKQLNQNGGELKLVDLSERLSRLFEITGLSNLINISVN